MRTPPPAALLAAAVTLLVAVGLPAPPPATAAALPYQDPALPVATRVDDLLGRMSLDEKIGQMTQAERASVTPADITTYRLGSVLSGGGSAPTPNNATSWADMYDRFANAALATPLGIPMIYGSDAVHGHNNVVGATIFPHNIGLGATRDPELVRQIGRATAEEVTGSGVDWTFAPCVCVVRNDRWGRSYESFGEQPALVSSMTSVIDGLQGSALNASGSILATAKHYLGDGGTTNGTDQGNTQLSEAELRAIHLPPFAEAVRRNVGSVMISYSSWNGQKLHGHSYLINDLLKGELGFDGFVVSDWNGIDQLDGAPGFTATEVRQAVNAGIDMVMAPTEWQDFITFLRAEVQAGRVSQARIDDANRRILTKKFELGLFERPLADRSYTSTVGSAAHRTLARQAVAASQVLLKNDGNILPLATANNRIFVAGKSADNIGYASGGWTISWQGGSGAITPGTTILQGIRNAVATSSTVTYNASGTGIDSSYRAAIAVVGETPYAEGRGDRPTGMGLDSTDLATLDRLRASGVPVIVVLVSGRPLDIAAQLPNWRALLAAWLPGTEGAGVADVLFGARQPTGKLPVSWMSGASQQPINDGDGKTPLFPYGFGLGYVGSPPADTTAPGVPGTPTATGTTATGTTLSWTASTDDVGVTGYRVYRTANGTQTLLGTVASTSYQVTGLTAATTYQFQVVAVDAAGNVSAPSAAVGVTTTGGSSGTACQVTYAVNEWGGGFSGNITIRNTGSTALSGWTLAFTFPSTGQRVVQGWSARWSQSGAAVTASNETWNANLAAGASVGIGFNGSHTGSNPRPTSFTLNGQPCGTG